jgi:hypothetical protein
LSFTFFTDRDLGKKFPAFLSAAGLKVERHQDHFADDASDEEWLEAIGKKGWVAVTHNLRIRYDIACRCSSSSEKLRIMNWPPPSLKPCPGSRRFLPATRRLSSQRPIDHRLPKPHAARRPDEWSFGIRKAISWLYREGLYEETARPRWFLHGVFG